MQELKNIIAKNIQECRNACGLTQLELAEKLNYSDKAVSKWERGESLPDISVLKKMSEIFGVSLDYLTEEVHHSSVKAMTSDFFNKVKKQSCSYHFNQYCFRMAFKLYSFSYS